MVEQKPSKLTTRVRFPSPAPISMAAVFDLEIEEQAAPGAGKRLRNKPRRARLEADNIHA